MKKLIKTACIIFLSLTAASFFSCKSDKDKVIKLYKEYNKALDEGDTELAAKIAAAADDILKRIPEEDLEELISLDQNFLPEED